jgi:hypothetical protein
MQPQNLSDLCDALELFATREDRPITIDNLKDEIPELERSRLEEVFEHAVLRKNLCGDAYPFDASTQQVRCLRAKHFDPYLFLLYGSNLFLATGQPAEAIKGLFRRHFEDFIRSLAACYLGDALVLSEPRAERGLPVSLRDALPLVAVRCGESAKLFPDDILDERLSADENDLGADIVAWLPSVDGFRFGRPVFFVQCATTRHEAIIETKFREKWKHFCTVWRCGFPREATTCALATPRDLIDVEPSFWFRLCELGWVLDRTRIVNMLLHPRRKKPPIPPAVRGVWPSLRALAVEFDFRHGWPEN